MEVLGVFSAQPEFSDPLTPAKFNALIVSCVCNNLHSPKLLLDDV